MGEDVQFNFEDDNTIEFDPNPSFEDEIDIRPSNKSVNVRKGATHRSAMKKPQSRPAPPTPSTSHQPPSQFRDTTFEAFSNPTKRVNEKPAVPSEMSDDVSEPGSDGSASMQSEASFGGYGDDEPPDTANMPSEGFATIDDEKQDLLYRFHRLESKGVKLYKKFNMYSDIREMRSEFTKIKRDSSVNSSVKFSKQILMTIVSGSELLNKRYDPFGIELNGWSETVMENVNEGDYDNIFERLHEKYAGKMNTPPELELMMSLAGSAVMFHLTSTMFKSIPNINDIAKQNPDVQNAMKSMAESLMRSQVPQAGPSHAPNDTGGRREMKGPSIDLSQFGSFAPPPMPSAGNMPPPPAMTQHEPPIFEIPDSVRGSDSESEMSGISVRKVSVAMSEGGSRRGRKPKITANAKNTIDI